MTAAPHRHSLPTPGFWPPSWNPYEVFILGLGLLNSVGLIRGHSGSQALDAELSQTAIVLWGITLGIGAALALGGVYCYSRQRTLMIGLHLERAGGLLVGTAAIIYSVVVFTSASDVDGVRYAVLIQTAFAAAAYFRAWQAARALRRAYRIVGSSSQASLDEGRPDGD